MKERKSGTVGDAEETSKTTKNQRSGKKKL
jgi:hypothetical protein